MPSCEDAELTHDAFYDALLDDNVEDLYENAPCGYLSTTPDGTVVKVNATLLSWTGHRREDVVGRMRFAQLLTPGGRIFYETHIAPMLRMQDRVREIAVDVLCTDGRRLPVLVNGVLKRDGAGEPLVVRVAVFDATERRAYERELLAARQRAEASEARATLLARTLQDSLIPPEPPRIPFVEVGAVYRPAGAGDEVGGDFYDVFETRDGQWAVVLGDVCGKGAEAASVTALARYTVRAAAMEDPSPAHVLGLLNEAVLRQHADRFLTAVYVRVAADGGGRITATVCGAGHPSPLLVPAEGGPRPVGRPGSLIGVFDEIEVEEVEVPLGPGDALVLYTDGITEARSGTGPFFGDERLVASLAVATGSANDVAEHLAADALRFQSGNARDDIAVLVLRAP